MNQKAAKLYKEIEPEIIQHKGEFVAIEIESGDYFVGKTEIQAYEKAIKKHPDKKFNFKRIGFRHSHFIGSFV